MLSWPRCALIRRVLIVQAEEAAEYLNFLSSLPHISKVAKRSRRPLLPPPRPDVDGRLRKTLVLDLDHTLIRSTLFNPHMPAKVRNAKDPCINAMHASGLWLCATCGCQATTGHSLASHLVYANAVKDLCGRPSSCGMSCRSLELTDYICKKACLDIHPAAVCLRAFVAACGGCSEVDCARLQSSREVFVTGDGARTAFARRPPLARVLESGSTLFEIAVFTAGSQVHAYSPT